MNLKWFRIHFLFKVKGSKTLNTIVLGVGRSSQNREQNCSSIFLLHTSVLVSILHCSFIQIKLLFITNCFSTILKLRTKGATLHPFNAEGVIERSQEGSRTTHPVNVSILQTPLFCRPATRSPSCMQMCMCGPQSSNCCF